jgi:hypothetical protein
LPGKRLLEPQRHPLSDCPVIILNPFEGAIETGGGNLERVGVGKRVGHVERRTERLVGALTITQRDTFRFIDEDPKDRTGPLPHADDIRQFQAQRP